MKKILLVDDDSFFAQVMSEFLADHGLHSTIVGTVEDALQEKLSQYDCAIIDVMLPNNPGLSTISIEETRGGYLSGIALARKLLRTMSNFPIVIISAGVAGGEAQKWAREHQIPFVFKHEDRRNILSALATYKILDGKPEPRAFIVHGHSDAIVAELKDYLQNTLKWPEPTVLRDQANSGKTIIEKFEEHASFIDWVFVLMTPDDKTFDPKTNEEKRRARQNVIFELGFFYGSIGRQAGRVIVLKKGDVELPSDINGIVWISIDAGIKASGEEIRKELGC